MYTGRVSIMEVDLSAFKFNVSQIQKFVGENVKIMPVIKANGYGTYINKRIDIINEFEIVAVALVCEAVELRKLGFEKEILVLNQPSVSEVQDIVNYDITIGISSKDFLNYIVENNKKIKVHIEIETGMNRTGVNIQDLDEFLNLLNNNNFEVLGLYSHLSSADNDEEYTNNQIKIFETAIDKVKEKYGEIKYIHLSASNGLLKFPNKLYNMVRPGIILYGYESFEGAKKLIEIKPICKLKSQITFLKEVKENTAIGYSQTYITNKQSKIATVPIGYADGIRRVFGNTGYVIINGFKVPIVGNVCMDSFMVDVTNIPNVKVGDDVYIWDNENILVEDLARQENTINYEILSTISNRVPRQCI